MLPRRIALLIPLLAVLALRLSAQQQAGPSAAAGTVDTPVSAPDISPDSSSSVPTFHSTARLVVLDVEVTDGNGQPVKGLKQSDFSVAEDGVPQTLFSFTERAAGEQAPATAKPPLPPNTFTVQPPISTEGTRTVIVLHSPPGFVRKEVEDALKTVAPGSAVCLLTLDSQGLHLVQDFTTDPSVLQEAITSKRVLPPLGFPVRFLLASGSPAQNLMRYLSNVPGRINLVWVGGGAGQMATAYPDLASFVNSMNGPNRVTNLSRIAFYVIAEGCMVQDEVADPDLSTRTDAIAENLFARANLVQLAGAVGGHVFCNGTKQALTEILSTESEYYTVSYVPTNPNWNGAYRKIRIDVAGIPEMTKSLANYWNRLLGWTEDDERKVIYRRGYFAGPRPGLHDDTASPASLGPAHSAAPARKLISVSPKGDPNPRRSSMQAAMGFGTSGASQIDLTVTVTPAPLKVKPKPGSAPPPNNFVALPFRYVPYRDFRIHYWIAPQSLQFSRTDSGSYRADLQFVAVVYRDDGIIANSQSVTEHIQVSEEDFETLSTSGVTFDQTIAMPLDGNPVPGNFFLRMGVHEMATDRIGAIEVPEEWIKLPASDAHETAANAR